MEFDLSLRPTTTVPGRSSQNGVSWPKMLHYVFEFLMPPSPANPLWERLPQMAIPLTAQNRLNLSNRADLSGVFGPDAYRTSLKQCSLFRIACAVEQKRVAFQARR